MSKVICPFHKEDTPSCHVYNDSYHCFGCGARGPLSDLEKKGRRFNVPRTGTWGVREDVKKSLARIATLPTKLIRGFELPYDDTAYYLVYPRTNYYLKRLISPQKSSDKYRGPFGHKRPLLRLLSGNYSTPEKGPLLVIEGEFNAMSAVMALGHDGPLRSVVSPGAASNFCRPDFVDYFLQYDTIHIIVDKDPAGVLAGITLRDRLLGANRKVTLHASTKDLNEIFCEQGPQAVKNEINLAMQGGV